MNFGYNQTQQQPFQTNPMQFAQVNYIQQQRQALQNYSKQQLASTFQHVFNLQNKPQFQKLIQILSIQQKTAIQDLQKATQLKDVPSNTQDISSIMARGQKIKQKNTVILQNLLLVKGKLQRLMYQNMNQHSKYEYESSALQDKIRTSKSQLTQKLAHLKTLKVNKSIDYNNTANTMKRQNIATVCAAMNDLQKGTQFLQKEVIKNKTQMEFVIKYVQEGQ